MTLVLVELQTTCVLSVVSSGCFVQDSVNVSPLFNVVASTFSLFAILIPVKCILPITDTLLVEFALTTSLASFPNSYLIVFSLNLISDFPPAITLKFIVAIFPCVPTTALVLLGFFAPKLIAILPFSSSNMLTASVPFPFTSSCNIISCSSSSICNLVLSYCIAIPSMFFPDSPFFKLISTLTFSPISASFEASVFPTNAIVNLSVKSCASSAAMLFMLGINGNNIAIINNMAIVFFVFFIFICSSLFFYIL